MLVLGPTKEEVFAECDENGEAWARAQYELATASRRLWLAEYLADLDIKRRNDRDEEQFMLQMKSIHATEAAAEAARKSAASTSKAAKATIDSALAARSSAKWTMVAAIAASAGVLLPFIKDISIWAYPIIRSWFY